jgi:hypothetical protein
MVHGGDECKLTVVVTIGGGSGGIHGDNGGCSANSSWKSGQRATVAMERRLLQRQIGCSRWRWVMDIEMLMVVRKINS